MNSVQVSIIIVNYGGISKLIECIDSLTEHTQNINYEIIVVNNEIAEEDINRLLNKYKQRSEIKFLNNRNNTGFAAANNQGVKIARGKYILLLNNDTVFTENSLLAIYNYVESQKDKLIVGCKLLNEDGTIQISVGKFDTLSYLFFTNFFLYKLFPRNEKINKYFYNYIDLKKITPVDYVKGAFLFISRDDFLKLNGFDESFFFYGEETELCYRFKKSGGKVIYFPETSIIHTGGASTGDISWFKFKNQSLSKLRMYRKQFKGYKLIIALSLHYTGLLFRVPLYFFSGVFSLNFKMIKKSYYYIKQIFILPNFNK